MSDSKECFFIAPIDDEGTDTRNRTDILMNYIVEEAVEEYDYAVVRSDQMDTPGSITSQIIGKIVNSELVIADLTDHNPNVFYELAVRHATGKPFIQLIQHNQTIPFDISDQRTIHYGLDVQEADQTKNEIQAQIESLESDDNESENPISRSADMQSLRESEDPTDQNLAEVFDEISTLSKKVDSLERALTKESHNPESEDFGSDLIAIPIGENNYTFDSSESLSDHTVAAISQEENISQEKVRKKLSKYGFTLD